MNGMYGERRCVAWVGCSARLPLRRRFPPGARFSRWIVFGLLLPRPWRASPFTIPRSVACLRTICPSRPTSASRVDRFQRFGHRRCKCHGATFTPGKFARAAGTVGVRQTVVAASKMMKIQIRGEWPPFLAQARLQGVIPDVVAHAADCDKSFLAHDVPPSCGLSDSVRFDHGACLAGCHIEDPSVRHAIARSLNHA